MFLIPFFTLSACRSGEVQHEQEKSSTLPPVAIIDGLKEVSVGETVLLSAENSFHSRGEKIDSYQWSCDNEQEGDEVELSFVPEIAGEITCFLEVTSNSGKTGFSSVVIVVNEAEYPQWTFMVFINGDSDLEYAGISIPPS